MSLKHSLAVHLHPWHLNPICDAGPWLNTLVHIMK